MSTVPQAVKNYRVVSILQTPITLLGLPENVLRESAAQNPATQPASCSRPHLRGGPHDRFQHITYWSALTALVHGRTLEGMGETHRKGPGRRCTLARPFWAAKTQWYITRGAELVGRTPPFRFSALGACRAAVGRYQGASTIRTTSRVGEGPGCGKAGSPPASPRRLDVGDLPCGARSHGPSSRGPFLLSPVHHPRRARRAQREGTAVRAQFRASTRQLAAPTAPDPTGRHLPPPVTVWRQRAARMGHCHCAALVADCQPAQAPPALGGTASSRPGRRRGVASSERPRATFPSMSATQTTDDPP